MNVDHLSSASIPFHTLLILLFLFNLSFHLELFAAPLSLKSEKKKAIFPLFSSKQLLSGMLLAPSYRKKQLLKKLSQHIKIKEFSPLLTSPNATFSLPSPKGQLLKSPKALIQQHFSTESWTTRLLSKLSFPTLWSSRKRLTQQWSWKEKEKEELPHYLRKGRSIWHFPEKKQLPLLIKPTLRGKEPLHEPVFIPEPRWPIHYPKKVPPLPKWPKKWEQLKNAIPEEKLEDLVFKGRKYMKQGRYHLAKEIFKKILKDYPSHQVSLLSLAQIYAWQRKNNQARRMYSRLLEFYPGSLEAYRGLGDIELWAQHPHKAMSWYELYLGMNPHDEDVWRSLARAASLAGNQQLLQKTLKRIHLPPEEFQARYIKPILERQRKENSLIFDGGIVHHFFRQGQIWQKIYAQMTWRPWPRKLLLTGGVEARIRYLKSTTIGEPFFYTEAFWRPKKLKWLYLKSRLGSSPLAKYAPLLYFDFDSGLRFNYFEFHPGYRFYAYPTRTAHILAPGITGAIGPFRLHVRYYLSLTKLTPELPWRLRHSFLVIFNWHALSWLDLNIAGGGGNAIDYLLEVYNPPTTGPSAGSETFSEKIAYIRAGARLRLNKHHFLIFSYSYYLEEVQPLPFSESYKANMHIIHLGYRWIIY